MLNTISIRRLVILLIIITCACIAGCETNDLSAPPSVYSDNSQAINHHDIGTGNEYFDNLDSINEYDGQDNIFRCPPGTTVFVFDSRRITVENEFGDTVDVRVRGRASFDDEGSLVGGRIEFKRKNNDGESEGVIATLRADLTGGNHNPTTDLAILHGFNIEVVIDASGDGTIRIPAGAIFPDVTEEQLTISPAIVIRRVHS